MQLNVLAVKFEDLLTPTAGSATALLYQLEASNQCVAITLNLRRYQSLYLLFLASDISHFTFARAYYFQKHGKRERQVNLYDSMNQQSSQPIRHNL